MPPEEVLPIWLPGEDSTVAPEGAGPVLVGVAESGQLEGYYVEVWRAEVEGWDIFYFNPVLLEWEFNSFAEDWAEAMEYGEAQGVRWCGGSGWPHVGDV